MEEFRSAFLLQGEANGMQSTTTHKPTRRETINNNNNAVSSKKTTLIYERPCAHSRSSDRSKPNRSPVIFFFFCEWSHTRESHSLPTDWNRWYFFPNASVRYECACVVWQWNCNLFLLLGLPLTIRTQGQSPRTHCNRPSADSQLLTNQFQMRWHFLPFQNDSGLSLPDW